LPVASHEGNEGGEEREALGMKELAYSLRMTSVLVVILVASSYEADSADRQTLDGIKNNVGDEPTLLAQNAAPPEEKSTNAAANVDGNGVILKGYDAVAYFKQGKAVKGYPAIASTHQGVRYLFASAANKADFDRDPAKYVPQYGGFCAYGVANGVLSNTEDANAFTLSKGKLYLCGNQDALKSFKANIYENIEKGDAYWRQVTGS
jgi:YHS domain-containing protein